MSRWSPFSGESTPWLTYAIRATHTGLIKIGKCHQDTAEDRFDSAEKLIGERCEWIGYLDIDERDAHRAMREFHVWREWFEPTDEFAGFLIAHTIGDSRQ